MMISETSINITPIMRVLCLIVFGGDLPCRGVPRYYFNTP